MKFFYILFICLSQLFSQPIITNTSGHFAQDSIITISGNSFGTKVEVNPVAWDNLEDGDANTTATIGSWGSVGYPEGLMEASSNEQRHPYSSYNAYADVPGNGNEYAAFRMSSGGASKWFIQYWFLVGDDWEFESGNIKIMRLWRSSSSNLRVQAPINNADIVVENSDINHGGYDASGCDAGGWVPVISETNTVNQVLGHSCGGEMLGGSVGWHNYENDVNDGEWHCFQWEYEEGDASNGVLKWWFDGQLIFHHSDINTGNTHKYPFIVGWYMSNSTDGNGGLYFDDAYIDTTWARVEIGNASTYLGCSHREIQIPTEWSTTSVTITCNQGSFANSSTAYLYVTDSNGTTSSGYQITFGDEASGGDGAAAQKKTDVVNVSEE